MKKIIFICSFLMIHCSTVQKSALPETQPGGDRLLSITQQKYGVTPTGQEVQIYTLTNTHGIEARITNLGGILVSLKTPDRNGKFADIVLGLNSLEDYLKGHPSFGAIVGRYANRIAKGKFNLGGKKYTLARNNGENHLHGGIKGFSQMIWDAQPLQTDKEVGLQLKYLSPDMEEGYPGNLTVNVVYTLNEMDELKIEYSATTDKTTVVNLTHHSYFNLAGQNAGPILNHLVQINANQFTPTDAGLIPTGKLKKVEGTALDFRQPRRIGDRIQDEMLKVAKGYDNNYVLNGTPGVFRWVAKVSENDSGRVLEVGTTEPGLQLYTGNWLEGIPSKNSKPYSAYSGFCLETQHYPDSPHHSQFPTTVLKPGAKFQSKTIYKFSHL